MVIYQIVIKLLHGFEKSESGSVSRVEDKGITIEKWPFK